MRKSGYPIRIAHEKFVKQFHVCADGIIHLKRVFFFFFNLNFLFLEF